MRTLKLLLSFGLLKLPISYFTLRSPFEGFKLCTQGDSHRLNVDVSFEVSLEDIFGQVGEEERVAGTSAQVEMLELARQLHRL